MTSEFRGVAIKTIEDLNPKTPSHKYAHDRRPFLVVSFPLWYSPTFHLTRENYIGLFFSSESGPIYSVLIGQHLMRSLSFSFASRSASWSHCLSFLSSFLHIILSFFHSPCYRLRCVPVFPFEFTMCMHALRWRSCLLSLSLRQQLHFSCYI